jgi:predicted PurR-regulated permease PerM
MESQSGNQPGGPFEYISAKRFFLVLLIGAVLLVGKTLWPLWAPLFVGAVFASVLAPLHARLSKRLRGRRALAAGILVFGIVVLVLAPMVGFSAFIFAEASQGYDFLSRTIKSEGLTGLVDRLPGPLGRAVEKVVALLPADTTQLEQGLRDQLAAGGGTAASAFTAALSATGSLAFDTAMMLIALFFLLLQGRELIHWVDSAMPVRPGQLAELLYDFKKVSYSVVVSTIITSGVQALAALVGYIIARLPHPFFFAALTFFVAFIPAVGAGAVCVGAALLLFVTGHPYYALFLAIWGVTVVALSDNLVRPLLIRGDAQLNGAVVFFALLGGLSSFGAVGLLVGPLAVSLLLALIRIYRRDFGQ